ncbi:hypothetical protein [Curtobacterium phage Parvaparticeps]|nr:hypothetical protein [Curtobacterium phage Parvaparticeps]
MTRRMWRTCVPISEQNLKSVNGLTLLRMVRQACVEGARREGVDLTTLKFTVNYDVESMVYWAIATGLEVQP